MRRSPSLVLLLLLSFSFLANIMPVSANFSVNVTVDNAFYADLDNDLYEDDIRVEITLTLSNYRVFTPVDIYVGVELPSGIEFWFYYQFIAEKYSITGYISMEWDLLDTALESGWYWAYSVGFAEGESFSYMDSLIFDPPGEGGGGDAKAMVNFV